MIGSEAEIVAIFPERLERLSRILRGEIHSSWCSMIQTWLKVKDLPEPAG